MNRNIPRVPNDIEKKQLVEFLLRDEDPETYDEGRVSAEHRKDIQIAVEEAYIAVFDSFITSTPGYVGKAMVVVWPTGLNYTEVYSWYKSNRKEYLAKEPIHL